MRAIKFRAWDEKSNKMAYFTGQPRVETNSPVTNLVITLENWKPFYPHDDSNYSSSLDTDYGKEVDNLMQFTGLLDKNGIDGSEIYEDDVLERFDRIRGVVKYRPSEAQFVVEDKAGYAIANLYGFLLVGMSKVIGNVWEDPKALETK